MKEIKTKPAMKTAKVLDKAVLVPRDMKNTMSKLKERTERDSDSFESPADYADQKIKEKSGKAAQEAADGVKSGVRKTAQKVRSKAQESAAQGGKRYAEKQAQAAYTKKSNMRSAGRYSEAPKTAKKTVSSVKQKAARSAKTARKGVKAASRTVKTTQRTVKTAAKTVKTTAKAAQAAKRMAIQAAKAAARAAKLVAKAVVAAVKAIIAAIKALIAAIAAGGWVAVLIIVIVAVVAAILCSAFGLFYSNETADGAPMTEIISSIDTEYRSGIDAKITELSVGDYDDIQVVYRGDGDGDSAAVNNWNDVLSVYAVLTTTKEDNPTDVVVVSEANEQVLREVFSAMNTVSFETEIQTEEHEITNDEGETETQTFSTLYIYIDQTAMSYTEGAAYYSFTDYQMEILEEMMSPEYYSYYAALIGIDVYGGENLTEIISGLPAGTMGSDVLKVALSKVGAPYVLGAKGPNKFDCSGLVYWSINEIDPALGKKLYTSAGYQYKYCKENNYLVGETELQPGDLIFWQKPSCNCGKKYAEIHHTGFYLGDGMILDASSSNGRVIIRKLFDGASYRIHAYARPYSY